MSGGFFRGTSADQDTRFSNKQAKLLKSQKFPPELENLVDMTKVKMDVIRPWIATRATEILGFEDDVLINFIYGLLDVKLVDGKKIQIQLTGFMEKNTGKFMKELWGLLLSAQNNVSGVPQQFLDVKEEETRKKKAETDRIASEIQKKREPERERERERKSRFEDEADVLRSVNAVPESVPRHSRGRSSSIPREEEREANRRQGSRVINGHSRSPQPNDRSPSPYRSTTSPTRSTKKTIARSRSHSGKEPKSRSVSVSSQSRGRSVSRERQYESPARQRQYESPARQSLSPERRHRSPRHSSSPRRRRAPLNTESPLRRRSPHLRRRSTSRSRHRSPPYPQRSPRARQRSPPSPRRRSPSLSRHRIPSPLRRGSLSPLRRRSPLPLRRRSPSPLRRRSPSPLRRRSPSPLRRRSPSPLRRISSIHRSRTPLRRRSPSPRRRRSPVKARRRSPSPLRHGSPIHGSPIHGSPIRRRSPSPWRRSPLRRSPNHRRHSPVPSPMNHPVYSHSSPRQRKRGHSPYRSRSPLYQARRSLSKEHDGRLDGHSSRRHRDEHDSRRTHEQNSPVNNDLDRELAEHAGSGQKASEIASQKVPISLRSPQRDVGNQNDHYDKVAAAITEDSPRQLDSPANTRKLNSRITRRFRSLSKSPVRQTRDKMPRRHSPGTNREEKETSRVREVLHHKIDSSGKRNDNSQRNAGLKRSYIDDHGPESNSPDRVSPTQSPAARGRPMNSKKNSGHRRDVDLPERTQQVSYSSYDTKRVREERGSLGDVHDRQRSAKHHPKDAPVLEENAHNEKTDGYGANDGKRPRSKGRREPNQELESIKQKVDKIIRRDSKDSDSEKTGSDKHHMEKRRHIRSDKQKKDSDESSESDSQIDDRKEAKRKRKDEKRLRKEEKRRRREEKHRKRLERRPKQKVKSVDTVTPPSDFKGNAKDSDNSDVDANMRKNFHLSDADEIESEQKKLEIELRKKALESLRAKKAISH